MSFHCIVELEERICIVNVCNLLVSNVDFPRNIMVGPVVSYKTCIGRGKGHTCFPSAHTLWAHFYLVIWLGLSLRNSNFTINS